MCPGPWRSAVLRGAPFGDSVSAIDAPNGVRILNDGSGVENAALAADTVLVQAVIHSELLEGVAFEKPG